MSEHDVTVRWEKGAGDFTFETYPRDHVWEFEGGVTVPASAGPAFSGTADRVDPEEGFVAALSSCHMLTFLAIAAKKRWVIERYVDQATGKMEKNDEGKVAITHVTLRPRILFGGEIPSDEQISAVHDSAHRHCFIANSVRSAVTVEPRKGETP